MTESFTVSDQEERIKALDPGESFIVQAPAGSGKTELLIQRFLTLLARVDQPESVVAITFTRRAAGEMRHRVIDALEQLSAPASESTHELQTRELAVKVLARDTELEWELIDHPSRLRILTIDSLCGSIVRQMPWLSRMGDAPRPNGNVKHLYRRAARETVGLLNANNDNAVILERLLSHLDNNVATLESLFSSMLERRDQWLRHVIKPSVDTDFRHSLESALRQIVHDELNDISKEFPDDLVGETIAVASEAAKNLIAGGVESPIASCYGLTALPSNQDRGAWLGLAELFLTQKGEARRKVNRLQGFPTGENAATMKERWKDIDLGDSLRSRLSGLRVLPPDSLSDTQWEILRGLMALLPVAAAQLLLVFRREGHVDFTQIAHASRTALGPTEAPTDLAFALDCRIQHLLVDEFQDTSQSQYELLERLTEEWQSGDGRTLFLVGDPMQSIYGFREAEVALFLRARKSGLGNIRLKSIVLSVNFRSTPEIVGWINECIGPAFPEMEDKFTGAVEYERSVAFAGHGKSGDKDSDRKTPSVSGVTIHPFLSSDSQPEATRVLEIIRNTRKADPESTIAVLVRARTHLAAIVTALRGAGEKFQAVEIAKLGERPVVQDLLALTRALLHPGDRIAWLSILRAPWCGLTLADLHTLVGGDYQSAVWDNMRDSHRTDQLSDDGRRRLGRVVKVLDGVLPRHGRLPLRRWVEAAWVELGGSSCLEDFTDLEDAAEYLDLLESSTAGVNIEDEGKFAADVKRLFARPDVNAPTNEEGKVKLQLLTVHKAKGLEFDTVILPGLGRYTRSKDTSLMLWLEYLDRQGKSKLLLAPVKEAGTSDDALYGYLRRVQSQKESHEDTRMLYVATTRARKELHVIGHTNIDTTRERLKEPSSRSLLRKIWPAVKGDFEQAFRRNERSSDSSVSDDQELGEGNPFPLRRLTADWLPPPTMPEFGWFPDWADVERHGDIDGTEDEAVHLIFDWASELQRRVGVVVHAMLQRTRFEGKPEWDVETVTAALKSEGLEGGKLLEATQRVNVALKGMMTDARGLWILADHEDDGRELALTGVVDGRLQNVVIDRTFVEDGVRWIIDYKTGTHVGGGVESFLDNEQVRYRSQLELYGRVMSHVDQRPIHLALYFPMLQGWREWPLERANS